MYSVALRLLRNSDINFIFTLIAHSFLFLHHFGTECGSLVDDTLESPGYPNNYPANMDCSYSVPIPSGVAMKIIFDDFQLESDDARCRSVLD